jgi:hypothetical protein
VTAAYFCLFLPFAIFLAGWVRPVISLPLLAILAVVFFRMAKSQPKLKYLAPTKDNFLKLLCILSAVGLWVYLAGIGRFAYQNDDHTIRNGIFELLLRRDWPVVLPPSETSYERPIALVYYIGFWLPAAAMGKVFGDGIGWLFQLFWASAEIFLFYVIFCLKFLKKIAVWPIVIFIAFSGLDAVGGRLMGNPDMGISSHIEWWVHPFQYSSLTTQLFWVFNQAVPAWLATVLMLIQKNNRFLVVIAALTMITSTIPFLGLIVLGAFVGIYNIFNKCKSQREQFFEMHPIKFLNKSFSVSDYPEGIRRNLAKGVSFLNALGFTSDNFIAGGLIGIVTFMYMKINEVSVGFALQQLNPSFFARYLLFFLLEAGVYLFAVYRYQKGTLLYLYSFLGLLAVPWITIPNSIFNEFCMRASIPFLMVLAFLVIDTFNKSAIKKDYLTIAVLAALILLGAGTSGRELSRTIESTIYRGDHGEAIARGSDDPLNEDNMDYFSGEVEGSEFFNYIAKTLN